MDDTNEESVPPPRGVRWPRQWTGDRDWIRQVTNEVNRLRGRPVVPDEPATVEEIVSQTIAEQEVIEEIVSEIEHRRISNSGQQFRVWRLAGLGLLLVLVLLVTLVRLLAGGPPTVDELRAESGVDTWKQLAVGVKDDQYGTAFYDESTGIWSGFDIDIAYMIAEDLGFRRQDVRFYGMESEDRARMQATDAVTGERVPVQMVIASYSITGEREAMAGVTFSQSYLYTEQSALTLNPHERLSSFEDMAGREVCTLSTATSLTALENAGAIVTRKNRISECVTELNARRVDAVSTDAAILAGYKFKFPEKYAHWDLGLDPTERWGVNVGENPALKTLVDLTLYRSWADPRDNRWEEAFERNLQVETGVPDQAPIAVRTQPRAERPDVSRLPWEDPLG
ncbi:MULTISPECIES: transporter substrate-binding domain-containing protein [Actinoplanes]|uniref:transporter substrate-binding domain-containing protein n=1 Tax=Actinoplanes TaxID=1865 RepID=UPI000696E0D9|nr:MULTISPECIES: transporter substrate-binding domain-containing protein [Actinoplanes]GLY06114.1 hypothetical protein Acsp01_64930 [Actinoplanes sp. NBRC 101535]